MLRSLSYSSRVNRYGETAFLPHVKSWLIGKDSDAGRDWGQEEKGTTDDEMAGWHHWLDGRESGWTPGVGDGQGGLACCDSWSRKESDTTEWLNWTDWSWNSVLTRITCRLPKEKKLDKENLVQLHFKRPSHMIQIPIYTILFSLLLSGIICTLNFHRFVIFLYLKWHGNLTCHFFSQIGNQLCQHLLLNNSSPHHWFQTPT